MAATRRLSVLVVEDDVHMRSLVDDILGDTATVHGAAGVEEAQRLLRRPRARYDLVIVDCLLPYADGRVGPRGVELIGEIHARHSLLPILAITGADEADVLTVAVFRSGARDLLRKPFGVDQLRASVARLTHHTGRELEARPRVRDGVARALAFLTEHAGEPVSLAELARVAGMSRSHLSRTFHRAVGVPLRVYLRNLRLERAQQMLTRSPLASLTDVALDAGFYDLPHFDKVFRERYGVSPSEFLRRKRLDPSPPRGGAPRPTGRVSFGGAC
jgi:AraC-like DNA-binding protein